jgi:hypothetical protein
MEKPDEEGLGVAVAGRGAWPNKLGRAADEDDWVGGKLKKKGAGHGAALRRVDEPPAWALDICCGGRARLSIWVDRYSSRVSRLDRSVVFVGS